MQSFYTLSKETVSKESWISEAMAGIPRGPGSMNGALLFIYFSQRGGAGGDISVPLKRFLNGSFPLSVLFRFRPRNAGTRRRGRTSASGVGLRRRGKGSGTQRGKDKSDEREVSELGLARGYALSRVCVCVCLCLSVVFHLIAWVSCVLGVGVVLTCMRVCVCFCFVFGRFVCVSGLEPQPPGEQRPSWLTCCAPPSTSLLSLSRHLFSTHSHFCVLKPETRNSHLYLRWCVSWIIWLSLLEMQKLHKVGLLTGTAL